jgi:hypothetical protein
MTLLLGALVLSVAAGYIAGGRLRGFERLELPWWPLALIGLAIQLLPVPGGRHGTDLWIRMAVLAASYAMLVVFAVRNVRTPGVPLILVGLVLNMAVVTVNGGMPVSEHAVVASGQKDLLDTLRKSQGTKHHLLTSDDYLRPLGDVIPVPSPIKQVVSVGDLFVYAGLAWLIVAVMRRRTRASAPPPESERYRGSHRRGSTETRPGEPPPGESPPLEAERPQAEPPPAGARTSGT